MKPEKFNGNGSFETFLMGLQFENCAAYNRWSTDDKVAHHIFARRIYAAPNFLKMGIKMPRFVVFWTTSTIKDENTAANFHYIKTVSGNVVAHSIAFRVVSIYWQGTTPCPWNLASKWPALSCQWYHMEDVRTHNSRTDSLGSSNFVEGLTTWPSMHDHWPKSKGQRSRSQGHVTYQQQ